MENVSVRDHLKKEKEPIKRVALRVPESLYANVEKQRRADGVSWNSLLIACLEAYLQESKGTGRG